MGLTGNVDSVGERLVPLCIVPDRLWREAELDVLSLTVPNDVRSPER